MSQNFMEEWLEALEAKFGTASRFNAMQSEGKPKIAVVYFDDLPEVGMLTAVTGGLSNATHPDWKLARPELMITMEGNNPSWGLGIAYFASAFFGEKRFRYGDMFKVDDPISPQESEMNGFLVFAPPFSSAKDFTFQLSDRKIILSGMYPVFDEEIAYYDQVGLEAFWHADGFEINNPKRSRLKAIK